jgi:ribonuclease HII
MRCTARLENRARRDGHRLIAGADEAGRGALFGPVMAAAVILDPMRPIRGLNDSKQLDPETRLELAPLIRERAIAWSVAALDAAQVDWINIYQASREAMRRAVAALSPQPDLLLVDALTLDVPMPQRSLIHGDAQSVSIAAASILAKVERDALMREWDAVYPGYGLASNKGYCTPDHHAGLADRGITPLHRLSYSPVAAVSLFPVALFEEPESPQLLLPWD